MKKGVLLYLPDGALGDLETYASGQSVLAHTELDEARESFYAEIANAMRAGGQGQKVIDAGAIGPDEAFRRLADVWGLVREYLEKDNSEDPETETLLTTLDHCLRGDPGHREPEEFEAGRVGLLKDFLDANGWA